MASAPSAALPEGLVQLDFPLALDHVLRRMRTVVHRSEVITVRPDGSRSRATYGEVAARCDKLAGALATLGVQPGDRVATLQWNSQEHLECYLAIPCMGAVLHTLNLRLFPEQLTYVINHAQDKVIVVDGSVTGLLARVADTLEPTLEHVVVVGEAQTPLDGLKDVQVHDYDELIAAADDAYDWPELNERQAGALCYTSGTTGDPKGVLYAHRSMVLHSMGAMTADALDLRTSDRILPVVPQFHANAWGIPYAAGMSGSTLVMPGADLSPQGLAKLIGEEGVTMAAGVPTIWAGMLAHAKAEGIDLSGLRLVICGGSAVPESQMRQFQDEHGVRELQAWGMTETSPLGSVARPTGDWDSDEGWAQRTTAGRISPLVEARIVGDDGNEVAWDGKGTGELQVRGPWIASAYYLVDAPDKFDDGWLRTGDIASIDEDGYIRITDRTKDVIKSGGEWISSVELENRLIGHPDVAEAAVISMPDEKWSERPLACVVPAEGKDLNASDLREFLAPQVEKFWLPDGWAVIDEVPKTSVGKFDKKALRARLESGDLEVQRSS